MIYDSFIIISLLMALVLMPGDVRTSPLANPSSFSETTKNVPEIKTPEINHKIDNIQNSDKDEIKLTENSEGNPEENVIPSGEFVENVQNDNINTEISEIERSDSQKQINGGRFPEKYYLGKDSSPLIEGKTTLNRFYKHDRQRSVSPSDTIVFPSASSYNPSYDQSFSDIYNKHRPPQSLGPQGWRIPFENFFYPTARTESETKSPRVATTTKAPVTYPPQTSIFGNLSPEQNQLFFQALFQLVQGFVNPSPNLTFNENRSFGQSAEQSRTIPIIYETESISSINPEEYETTTPISIADQSLYSGPRVQKSACPSGQHRTPSGTCTEKSRKLLNSG